MISQLGDQGPGSSANHMEGSHDAHGYQSGLDSDPVQSMLMLLPDTVRLAILLHLGSHSAKTRYFLPCAVQPATHRCLVTHHCLVMSVSLNAAF